MSVQAFRGFKSYLLRQKMWNKFPRENIHESFRWKLGKLGEKDDSKIVIMSKQDALDALTFLEMLLRFVYEFPGKAKADKSKR